MAASTASGEPKCLSSARLRAGPMPGQLVHDRLGHRLVAPDAVVGDREAVRLVADALQRAAAPACRAAARIGSAVAGQEDLLDALGQRDDGDAALAEALQRLQAGGELALAAVDDHEVRQRGERRVALGVVGRALVLLLPLARSGVTGPPHRREIVAAVDLADA